MRIILAFAVALAALALVGRTAVSAIPEESRTGPSAPPTGTSAPPTGPPAPPHLSDLYEANYITAHEVSARLHHGDLFINSGVVAIFPGLSRRLGGMFIGDVDFVLTTLPRGEGVLNLFREINPRKRTVAFNVEAAYLSAQYSEEVYVYPSGYATAVRSWDELEKQEQEQFEAIYLQAYSDAWLVEEQTGESGGLALRDPVGKEIYAAFWTREGERFDYRVDESGEKLTIDNYSKGVRFFESPWSPEEGELDENVQFSSLHYTYGLGSTDPVLGDGSEFSLEIRAAFTVKEDCASIRLVSAPWVNCESLHLFDVILPWEDEPFTIERGATGFSDWIVTVKTPLQAGKQYALDCLSAQPFPQSYEGIGYGGVYRFDSSPLWPGEDSSVNITISAWLPGEEWAAVASGNPPVSLSREPSTTDPPSAITKVTMQWEASTRSQMIVATQFPMRKLQTDWGVLEVYTPPELIDSVNEMEYITAIGPMMEYYSELWGEWQIEDKDQEEDASSGAGGGKRQVVFLIPGETGVQAFEDAGFIFILGGSRVGIPLVAHEVAHLWWGQGFSGPRWFQEGMANYGAAKFIEHYYGDGGPAAGEGDPLSYRRYLLSFGLGHELPLGLKRRDELDDSAAIYHLSAGALLTADARLPDGLDGILTGIYAANLNAPHVSHEALRTMFVNDGGDELAAVWDAYIEHGEIEQREEEDESYREFVWTPGRGDYVRMLRWLNPAYMKSAIGDYPGALYCANRALKFRDEPKDRLFVAELTFKSGDLDGAKEQARALIDAEATDKPTLVKAHFLLSKIARALGERETEQAHLQIVVDEGPGANLMYQVQAARERMDEMSSKRKQ